MDIGQVIGNVWATKKDANLNGIKLLVVSINESNFNKKEKLLVAADIVGAGEGDTVLITYGGSARIAINNKNAPVDAAIVGIVDSVEVNKNG